MSGRRKIYCKITFFALSNIETSSVSHSFPTFLLAVAVPGWWWWCCAKCCCPRFSSRFICRDAIQYAF